MIIPIKQALLEGYTLETIVEAIHANNKQLDKRRLKDPKTSYAEGKKIEQNRKALHDDIKDQRNHRDFNRKLATDPNWADAKREKTEGGNYFDNFARARSQTGGRTPSRTKEFENFDGKKIDKIIHNVPRVISSAKE